MGRSSMRESSLAKRSLGSPGPGGRNRALSLDLQKGPFAQAPWRPCVGLRGKGWNFLRRPQSILRGLRGSAIRFKSSSEGNREVAAAMEAADEDAGGTAGAGSSLGGPEDQCGTGGPNSRGLPSVLEGHGGLGDPSGSGDVDTQSGPCSPADRGGCGTPNGQGAPHSPPCQGDPGDEETMGSAAIGARNVQRAARASGPASVSVGPGNRKMTFKLTVPFRCPLEAEIARRSMDQEEQGQLRAVGKEFKVKGSVLAVRWTAEDPGLLRVSVNAFLGKLSVVMGNIQRIWPLFPPGLSQERGSGA
ncbi:cancer/testis antigen 1-like [Phyllostomus discolor]|uniref:L antigen family member 3 n=1 Tax=Phyllostomus discolor TaxID=89673 RepID=A0A7E6CZ30_9CHIR|nr:cancer/testis antigen 1-like [Phyllostomus discolor]